MTAWTRARKLDSCSWAAPAELGARALAELGEDYAPSTKQIARIQEFGRACRSGWGSGASVKWMFPSGRLIRQVAMCRAP